MVTKKVAGYLLKHLDLENIIDQVFFVSIGASEKK